MIRRALFNSALVIADVLGLNRLFRALYSRKIRVLMYHGVSKERLPSHYWLHVNADGFDWQMNYLKSNYKVMPATVLCGGGAMDSTTFKRAVVITFDDGFENVFTTAWPILRKLRLPAVCFVVPGLSERRETIWSSALFEWFLKTERRELDLSAFGMSRIELGPDRTERARAAIDLIRIFKSWPAHKREELKSYLLGEHTLTANGGSSSPFALMTKEQIIDLGNSEEFDIAPHGDRHQVLTTFTREEQQQDIASSVGKLTAWHVPQIPVFSYPSGRFNEDTVSLMNEMGFKAALATEEGLADWNADRYSIKRIHIGSNTGKFEFKARVSGLYYFLLRLAGQ